MQFGKIHLSVFGIGDKTSYVIIMFVGNMFFGSFYPPVWALRPTYEYIGYFLSPAQNA